MKIWERVEMGKLQGYTFIKTKKHNDNFLNLDRVIGVKLWAH